jgi:DNA ligase-associated metallophosphoesterase
MQPLPINLREQVFELHPLRAMWWAKHSMLICADVHIGKGAHFRRSGIPIPKRVNDSNLWNLVVLIEHYKPRTILFLGDLFHSSINQEWEELNDCLSQFPLLEKFLVKGNHEIESQNAYEKLGFSVHDNLSIENMLFTHEPPQQYQANYYTLCGHLHPAVRLTGHAQQRLRLPCFWMGPERGVLPAFGEFTGSHTIQPKKGDQLFVIAEDRVVRIG